MITTRRQLRGRAGILQSAATVGNIVRSFDANSVQRRRAFVAAFIAFWTVIVGAEWALPGVESAPAHGPHTVVAGAEGAPMTVALDHAHFWQADNDLKPDTFAEAILPRATLSLSALGLAIVLAALPALWLRAAFQPLRGPPRSARVVCNGRDLLVRLCIARR